MGVYLRHIPRLGAILVLVICVISSFFLDDYLLYLLSLAGVYIIFALGYNLLMGYAGQFDFGQAAFLGIGAYATALLQIKLGVPFLIAIPLGGLIAVCFGLGIGYVVLRLSGFYLALVTLAFNQTVVLVLSLWTGLTKGFQGLPVPRPHVGALHDALLMFYIITLATILMVEAARNIVNSRVGKAFMAIRDSEVAAEAMGINLTHYRVMAYGLSAFYGGIAGGLLAPLISHITPQGFGIFETIRVLTMIVIGGMSSIAGSVIGAVTLIITPEFLRVSRGFQDISNGLLLFLFIVLMPNGIYGLIRSLKEGRLGRLSKGKVLFEN